MNKHEAAEYIGVSVRTLQRIAQKKKYRPKYERGSTGQRVATFDRETLDSWKRELEAGEEAEVRPGGEGASDVSGRDTEAGAPVTALARRADQRPAREFAAMIAQAIETARAQATSISDLAMKPLLKLDEAARLTGLSRHTLRQAVEEKKLKAKIVGRAWRIRREDLDAYLRKL